jgi:hypothetical protein
MGMGQDCKCQLCEFQFQSGHSHHEGNSSVLCEVCLAEYALPTESPWGPRIGEIIFLYKVVRASKPHSKKKPPGAFFSYVSTDEFLIAESAGEWGVNYPIGHMVCPCCENKGSLVLDFEDGQHCPRCRDGVLKCCLVEY